MALKPYQRNQYTDILHDEKRENLYVITFNVQRFVNASAASQIIREEWQPLLSKKEICVVVDLAEVEHPVSMLAGIFFWAFEDLAKHNSTMALCNAKSVVLKMLLLCGVDKIIPVATSYQQAREMALTGAPSRPKKRFFNIFRK